MIKDEIIFWGFFLIFNYLQFLPNYIFNYKDSDFLPYLDKLKGNRIGFFVSLNMDPFRYLIEVSLFIFLVKFKIFPIPLEIIVFYYLFLFIYNFYHQLFWTLYEVYPAIYNDMSLMKTGMAILWRESKFKLGLSFFSGIVLLVFISFVFYSYLNFTFNTAITIFDWIICFCFLLLFSISIIRYYVKKKKQLSYDDRRLRFLVGFIRLFLNIKFSMDLSQHEKRIKSLSIEKIREQPIFSLNERPNLFILFIESYGSILLEHEEMQIRFKEIFESFEKELLANDWNIMSNLSRAPSSAAFSWLSYASFLYGYNISQHTHYERFLKNPIFYKSDNLMRILKNKGYTTYFLNPIKPNPRIKIDYTYLTPFYAVDKWILYDDLNYTGNCYGFGDFPPDQYSLNRSREIIEDNNSSPFILFFLTKNSHSPFFSPDTIVNDWHALNHRNGKSYYGGGFLERPTISNYLKAIQYQLKVIDNFIIRKGSENDIYFIVGDHQPPILNKREKSGLNTPIHIVSKNRHFLKGFSEYGFRKSLFDDALNPVRHESMYSAILRELIKNFSADYHNLPAYEPFGLQI